MRAEGRVGAELRALGQQQQQQEAAAVAVGRNKNSKLTFLLGELCERGRLDLVCALPWGAGQGGEEEDEVAQIQDRMRTNARFSAVEGVDGEENGVVGVS